MKHDHIEHDFLNANERLRVNERKTFFVVVLTALTMVLEIGAGYWSGSMSLLADGWHMGSHAGALLISVLAYRWSRNQKFKKSLTFGAGKLIPLGGYTSAIILAIIAVIMCVESIERILHPVSISFSEALGVAVFGLVINLISVAILHDDHDDHFHLDKHTPEHTHHHHDHNLQSAYVHVLADALTSVLAIVALLLAWFYGWVWLDPVVGILGSIVIMKWAYGLVRETAWELLDGEAKAINFDEFRKYLQSNFDVQVLDLHVWKIAPKSFCCELVLKTKDLRGSQIYREKILDRYHFAHLVVEERL